MHDDDDGNAAAGTGLLDYRRCLSVLLQAGFDGPLILHDLNESQAAHSVAFVRRRLAIIA